MGISGVIEGGVETRCVTAALVSSQLTELINQIITQLHRLKCQITTPGGRLSG